MALKYFIEDIPEQKNRVDYVSYWRFSTQLKFKVVKGIWMQYLWNI